MAPKGVPILLLLPFPISPSRLTYWDLNMLSLDINVQYEIVEGTEVKQDGVLVM